MLMNKKVVVGSDAQVTKTIQGDKNRISIFSIEEKQVTFKNIKYTVDSSEPLECPLYLINSGELLLKDIEITSKNEKSEV